jgi:anti-sigma factor ChrR (cupin superfamily)
MTEQLAKDDALLLDELVAETIEPVTPPSAVKLRLMSMIRDIPQNSRTVRSHEGHWTQTPMPGVKIKLLTVDKTRGTATVLMDLAAGAMLPEHDHHGDEQTFVLSGSCRIGGVSLEKGDFHHVGGDAHHGRVVSDGGCVLLLVVDEADYRAA